MSSQFLYAPLFQAQPELLFRKSVTIIATSICVVVSVLCAWKASALSKKLPTRQGIFASICPVACAAAAIANLLFSSFYDVPCDTVVHVVVGILTAAALCFKQLVFTAASDNFVPPSVDAPYMPFIQIGEWFFSLCFLVLYITGAILSPSTRDFFGGCEYQRTHGALVAALVLNTVNSFWASNVYLYLARDDSPGPLAGNDKRTAKQKQLIWLNFLDKLASLVVLVIFGLGTSLTNAGVFYAQDAAILVLLALAAYFSTRVSQVVASLLREKDINKPGARRITTLSTQNTGRTDDSSEAGMDVIDLASQNRVIQNTSLLLLVSMTVLALISIHVTLGTQTLENSRINIAGRQRMLSQRFTLECYEVVYNNVYNISTIPAGIARVKASLALWTTSDAALKNGDPAQNLSDSESDVLILREFQILAVSYSTMLTEANAFVTDVTAMDPTLVNFNNTILTKHLEVLTGNRVTFLQEMDHITVLYENRSNARYKLMIILQGLVFSGTMITILLQISILIKPNYRSSKDSASENSDSDQGSHSQNNIQTDPRNKVVAVVAVGKSTTV